MIGNYYKKRIIKSERSNVQWPMTRNKQKLVWKCVKTPNKHIEKGCYEILKIIESIGISGIFPSKGRTQGTEVASKLERPTDCLK